MPRPILRITFAPFEHFPCEIASPEFARMVKINHRLDLPKDLIRHICNFIPQANHTLDKLHTPVWMRLNDMWKYQTHIARMHMMVRHSIAYSNV